MDTTLLIILRAVHIFAGVLWVGSAIFYLFLVQPAVKSIGTSGHQFMQSLITRQRYPVYMGINATLTIVSGILLFPSTSGLFQPAWLKSGPGIGFTAGSLVGISVFFVGAIMVGPRSAKLGKLGQELSMAGGPPSPAQLSAMEKLDKELTQAERLDFVLLTISLLFMATARYFAF